MFLFSMQPSYQAPCRHTKESVLTVFTAKQLLLQKKGARAKRAGPSGSLEPEDQPTKASKKRKAPSDAPGVCLRTSFRVPSWS